MIFVSDRRESVGGFDLFISYKEDNDWSAPINLGNLINTPGNETSPFLDQENNLFFSSDGIKGYGGYDIYLCHYNGRGWDKPVNLTQRINTPDNDLAFTLSRLDAKSAFFTTSTKSGDRSPKLFRVTFRDPYSIRKFANLSNAFQYVAQAGFSPEEAFIAETDKQVEVNRPDTLFVNKPDNQIEVNKPEKEEPVAEAIPPQKQPEIKQEPLIPPVEEAPIASDAIIYRVQFASNAKPKGSYEISSGGKKYKTFEYLYNGAYRSCAGDFTAPGFAVNLQNQLKREGYPDAFMVAFRNNERLTGSIQSIAKSQEQPEQKPLTEMAQTEKPVKINEEPAKPPVEEASVPSDEVIYRVQFASNSKSRGSYEIIAGGKKYKTYEYLYNGAYRSCAGEFSNKSAAAFLQSVLKREGFPDAFVVAFKNDVRLTDPALFR